MEIWDLEVESGDGTDVKVQQGTYLIISEAYIEEVMDIQEESIYLHITRNGKKALVGNINPHIQPKQNMRLLFDRDFRISHTLKNKSLHLDGVVYEKNPCESDEEKEDTTKNEEARGASDCVHYCRRFMKLEFWGSEIKCGEPLAVKLDEGSSLHLRQASLSLGTIDNKPKEPVLLEVGVGDRWFVMATFNSKTLLQERIDLEFHKDIQFRHNLTNGSVYLYGMQLKRRVHSYHIPKLNFAKEEASLASECARTCSKQKMKEFWGVKIEHGQLFDTDLGPNPFYLHLRQASLIPGEMDQKTSQSVNVHVCVDGKKIELANLHTESNPQDRFRRGFEQNIRIQHDYENGSVNLLGILTMYKQSDADKVEAKGKKRKVEVASSKCAHCCKFCHRTLLSDNEDERDAA